MPTSSGTTTPPHTVPAGETVYSPAELRLLIDQVPRVRLAHLPTPLEFLPRFSQAVGGPPIYIKRDDCTGLACGGNKTRHNEFVFGDARQKQADQFVWGAGIQSNNCRQTAAACAKLGIPCHLMLGRGGPAPASPAPGGPTTGPEEYQGNLLLDHLVGAKIEIVEESLGPALDARLAQQAERYRAQGRRPYFYDPPVVKPLAALSYVLCLVELAEQFAQQQIRPAAIYVCSAGATGAGAVLGRKLLGLPAAIRNVAALQWPYDTQSDMAEIATAAARLLRLPTTLDRDEIDVRFDQIAPGYGKSSEASLEAIQLLARTEGILLDPVYTSKAMAGLIADVRQGHWSADRPVVLIHTGGTPAIFSEHAVLSTRIPPVE